MSAQGPGFLPGDIQGDESDDDCRSSRVKRRRLPLSARQKGDYQVFVLRMSSDGMYQALKCDDEELYPPLASGDKVFVGAVLARWELLDRSGFAASHDAGLQTLRGLQKKGSVAVAVAFLIYKVFAVVCAATPTVVTVSSPRLPSAAQDWLVSDEHYDPRRLREQLRLWHSEYDLKHDLQIVGTDVSPGLANQVLQQSWSIFHVLPLRAGCRPSRYLLGDAPSLQEIRAFIDALPEESCVGRLPPPRRVASSGDCRGYAFEVVLRWIKATKDLKQIRKKTDQKIAWASIFAKGVIKDADALAGQADEVGYEVIRRGRCRLDAVACILARQLWQSWTSLRSLPWICVFTDASPQWRGKELMATSVEFHFGGSKPMRQMMLPLIRIGSDMRTLVGKTFAVLWQIFLVVGPTYSKLRSFTEQVVAFTVDLGTERGLPAIRDLLPQFCRSVGIPVPDGCEARNRTFPGAIVQPGWHHVFDGLLQRGLSGLDWFPSWLLRLKGVLTFLRNNLDDVLTELRAGGREAAGQVLASVPLPLFAHWRWRTLFAAVASISKIYDTLRENFASLEFVKRLREGSKTAALRETLSDEAFVPQMKFVSWFTAWLGGLEQWGGSCLCHPDRRSGDNLVCDRKGRLLKVAYPHAVRELDAGLADAQTWEVTEFAPLQFNFTSQVLAAVRMTHAVAFKKLQYLDRVPYVLARWGEGGIKEKALSQFDSVAEEKHELITQHLLGRGTRTRALIERESETEALNDPEVMAVVVKLRSVCFDDSKCESPHARASREGQVSRRSRWPWIASSVRLDENISFVDECSEDYDVRRYWSTWKSVLQTHPKHQCRNKKIAISAALDKFYWLPSASAFDKEDGDEDRC